MVSSIKHGEHVLANHVQIYDETVRSDDSKMNASPTLTTIFLDENRLGLSVSIWNSTRVMAGLSEAVYGR